MKTTNPNFFANEPSNVTKDDKINLDGDKIIKLVELYFREGPDSYTLDCLKLEDRNGMYQHILALSKVLRYKEGDIKDLFKIYQNIHKDLIDNYVYFDKYDNDYCLDKNSYLIDHNLQYALNNGYLPKNDNTMKKDLKGVYIVVLKRLNKQNNVLIYKYLYYPYLFLDCFNFYFNNIYVNFNKNYVYNLFIMNPNLIN